ncbi:hypothetical protein O6H91_13G027000 [Diphasiastrum complanatum]|uniref:Uncharacterized protein n=1 Tax=Diphasiastrum complanatum TaxID=34168 RepID=A0ACC2BT43_DIPCM|nr:hypothetical protein O6H91_13G027000 [Diphasiastrum complanatum]
MKKCQEPHPQITNKHMRWVPPLSTKCKHVIKHSWQKYSIFLLLFKSLWIARVASNPTIETITLSGKGAQHMHYIGLTKLSSNKAQPSKHYPSTFTIQCTQKVCTKNEMQAITTNSHSKL